MIHLDGIHGLKILPLNRPKTHKSNLFTKLTSSQWLVSSVPDLINTLTELKYILEKHSVVMLTNSMRVYSQLQINTRKSMSDVKKPIWGTDITILRMDN